MVHLRPHSNVFSRTLSMPRCLLLPLRILRLLLLAGLSVLQAQAQVGQPYAAFAKSEFSVFFNWAESQRIAESGTTVVELRPGGFMEYVQIRLRLNAADIITEAALWLSPDWAANPKNDLYVRPLAQAFFTWAMPVSEGAVPALWPGSPVAEVLVGKRQAVLMAAKTLEAAAEQRTCVGQPVLELRVVQAPKLDYALLAGGNAVLLPLQLLTTNKLELIDFDYQADYVERRYVSQNVDSRLFQLVERVERLASASDARSRFYTVAGEWSQGRCPLDLTLPEYAQAVLPILPLVDAIRVFGSPPEGGIAAGVTHGFSYLVQVRNIVLRLTITGDERLNFADGTLLLQVLAQRALEP